MKKWYVDEVFVREGRMYDRGYTIREDGIIEWSEPIQNGATHEFPIGECFHPVNPLSVEPGHPIMIEDGELIGELVEVSVERIDIREDFPNHDEAYVILRGEDSRYAFAWGPKYPYADIVPAQDAKDGESGIEWFDSEDEARAAMKQAIEAWSDVRGGK